jgi:hypothetical protein
MRTRSITDQSSGLSALYAYWQALLDRLPFGRRDAAPGVTTPPTPWQRSEAAFASASQLDDAHHATRSALIAGGPAVKKREGGIVGSRAQLARIALVSASVIPEQPTRRTGGRGLLSQSRGVERGAARTLAAKRKLGEARADVPYRPTGIAGAVLVYVVE